MNCKPNDTCANRDNSLCSIVALSGCGNKTPTLPNDSMLPVTLDCAGKPHICVSTFATIHASGGNTPTSKRVQYCGQSPVHFAQKPPGCDL
ncbi:hypothetical protein BDR06DRAFT_957152 [Suillus hirtellus]|nr:hypothetical protein BDR06DRAFT_957152 [Suillus hirtellus]